MAADSFLHEEPNKTQQVFNSQEQVAVDILQGFHAIQEDLNTCSYGNSNINSNDNMMAFIRRMEQEFSDDYCPEVEDGGTQLQNCSNGDVERTPALKVGAGLPSTTRTATVKYPATHVKQLEDFPPQAPMSIPFRQPLLFASPPPCDTRIDTAGAATAASDELPGRGWNPWMNKTSSAAAQPSASGRTISEGRISCGIPADRVVIEDTYAALVHDSLMQALDYTHTAGDDHYDDDEEDDEEKEEGGGCEEQQEPDGNGNHEVEDLDGEEDWVESYMTQRSQTLHSSILLKQPQPQSPQQPSSSSSSSSSQTIFLPSPAANDDDGDDDDDDDDGTYSPVLDPNITCIPDTYAPADFDAAMDCNDDDDDRDGDRDRDDSATQLRASLDWNAHIVPETYFEDVVPARALVRCCEPNPIVLVGDDGDDRSVVSSIHGMPGDESMCVLMTQSPSYPAARQVTVQITTLVLIL